MYDLLPAAILALFSVATYANEHVWVSGCMAGMAVGITMAAFREYLRKRAYH